MKYVSKREYTLFKTENYKDKIQRRSNLFGNMYNVFFPTEMLLNNFCNPKLYIS